MAEKHIRLFNQSTIPASQNALEIHIFGGWEHVLRRYPYICHVFFLLFRQLLVLSLLSGTDYLLGKMHFCYELIKLLLFSLFRPKLFDLVLKAVHLRVNQSRKEHKTSRI